MEIIFPIIAILGALASLIGTIIERFAKRRKKEETIEDRVGKLTSSIREAVSLIAQIETEINKRSTLAEKLKADVEYYNKLKIINSSEIEAIAQVLRSELHTEGTRSFWKSVALNFVFFLLGAVVSFLIAYFINVG